MMNKKILNMSVLVVEDDVCARKLLVEILQLYFTNVIFSVDGCHGLEKINKFFPDIIICDIKMPCLDGLSLAQKIKSNTYRPIFIVSTAFSDKEYLLKALNLHVDAYLIKPINIDILLQKIEDSIIKSPTPDVRHKKLSVREFEVFLDLAKGIKPAIISKKYSVKAKTISTYRERIFEKMSFQNNADLVRYAIVNNLV